MKVILLQDIARLGKRGEVKEVADGFAINVLIKKGQAILATQAELTKWKQQEDAKRHKKELATSTFLQLVDSLRKTPIVIAGKKHDDKGQLFAQVKEEDIEEAIFAITKLSVSKKQIIIPNIIKSLGKHSFMLKEGGKEEQLSLTVS